MGERDKIQQAIAALEGQRAVLGDAVVDTALAPLRDRIVYLDARETHPSQERKQATMLLADVCGFTALSEAMDAEEIGDLMNALWQRVDRVILNHGGTVDKHIGDAVMALWGVNRVTEHDPEHAVRAALAMQAELAAFRDEHQVPLTLRIGVNTGPVLLGNVGTVGEYSAVGQTVNLTKRLEQAALPDGVLISHNTYRHVQGAFDLLPHGPVEVRGRPEPLEAYIVLRAKPRAFRTKVRGVEGIDTRMVGRDHELAALQGVLRSTIAESRTRLVTVTGDAGVGKSRLLYEFETWIDLQNVDVWYLKSRAVPTMQSVPYSVIRDLIAFRFEILETDTTDEVLIKFRSAMADVLRPDEADLVGHMVGFDFSTSPAVQRLLDSPSFGRMARSYLLRYLRSVAQQPTVVFLEDTHWADDSTLDLVAELTTEVPDGRMMIVCLARPQLFERRSGWMEGSRPITDAGGSMNGDAHIVLPLGPLPDPDSGALVDEILQRMHEVPDELRDLVVRTADGNPYYVEELIKRLIEDDVIVRDRDGWRVRTDRLDHVSVPSTLTGVLQARLDDLPQIEKTVLQWASVVGRTFWDAIVAELAGGELSKEEVEQVLHRLSERDLVFRHDASTFDNTSEYAFSHAVLRDVTYETVLRKQRLRHHARVARWLESRAGERREEYLGLIAGHYERAGEKSLAAIYLMRYGLELRRISAYRDTIVVGQRTLALLPDRDRADRAAVMTNMGEAYRQMGNYPEAVHLFEEGLSLSRKAGEPRTEVEALNGLGLTVRVLGQVDEAERHLHRALELARAVDERVGMANSLYNLGDVAFRRGDAELARQYGDESKALYEEVGDRQGVAFALRVLGFAALLRGDLDASTRCQEASRAMYAELGDRWGVAACLINLGEVARKRGNFERAIEYYKESQTIASETGAGYEVVICQNNLGHAYVALGRLDEARACLCEALAATMAMGTIPVSLEAMVGVADLRVADGRPEDAAELIGMISNHPAFSDETGQYAELTLNQLRRVLSGPQLDAALERGRAKTLEEAASSILDEC